MKRERGGGEEDRGGGEVGARGPRVKETPISIGRGKSIAAIDLFVFPKLLSTTIEAPLLDSFKPPTSRVDPLWMDLWEGEGAV